MDRLVDVDQDIDFIGKDALKKIKKNGPSSKLIGVEMDGNPIDKVPENFWPVLDENGTYSNIINLSIKDIIAGKKLRRL